MMKEFFQFTESKEKRSSWEDHTEQFKILSALLAKYNILCRYRVENLANVNLPVKEIEKRSTWDSRFLEKNPAESLGGIVAINRANSTKTINSLIALKEPRKNLTGAQRLFQQNYPHLNIPADTVKMNSAEIEKRIEALDLYYIIGYAVGLNKNNYIWRLSIGKFAELKPYYHYTYRRKTKAIDRIKIKKVLQCLPEEKFITNLKKYI